MKSKQLGHLAAIITIMIWGTTFISTKILLVVLQPMEILLFRFMIGFLILLITYPHRLKGLSVKQELTFMAAGLCGICLYYLFENIALMYTTASHVGVIISVAPFMTAIFSHLLHKEEKLNTYFFIGFILAIAGIMLMSLNASQMAINPIGDILAFIAAIVWACYSLLTRKISSFGFHVIASTRRTFFYGILFMIPMLFFFDFKFDFNRLVNVTYLFHIFYLGIGASALCFVTWNYAIKILGAIQTSVYIYMVPVITVVTSVIILKEQITKATVLGTVLTVIGLFLSEHNDKQL